MHGRVGVLVLSQLAEQIRPSTVFEQCLSVAICILSLKGVAALQACSHMTLQDIFLVEFHGRSSIKQHSTSTCTIGLLPPAVTEGNTDVFCLQSKILAIEVMTARIAFIDKRIFRLVAPSFSEGSSPIVFFSSCSTK